MQPVGPDPPSQLRVAITNNATTTDNAAIWLTGSLAARASISPLVAGTLYKATDTGLLYHYDGTAWTTVMLAGAWQNLTLNTGAGIVATGGYVPSVRLEGDAVRLKGTMQNQSGGSFSGTWATVPSGWRPSAHMSLITYVQGNPDLVSITTAGVLSVGTTVLNNQNVALDGVTYSLT